MFENVLTKQPLYIFAKDKNLKYLFCNEYYSESAGLDSPSQIVGKTDNDLAWKEHADYYHKGDFLVINGKSWVNIPEIQTQPTRVANILVTKTQLMNKDNHCIGVLGSYFDITDTLCIKRGGRFDAEKQRFYLGESFSNAYLTRRQLQIFRYILYGCSFKKIAFILQISLATVQWYTQALKIKFQCHSIEEVRAKAIQYGFTYILGESEIWKVITDRRTF